MDSLLPLDVLAEPLPIVFLVSDSPFGDRLADSLTQAGAAALGVGIAEVKYRILPTSYPLPPKKPDPPAPEGWVPPGIIKTSWLSKHQDALPSVVAPVFDVDLMWGATEWSRLEGVVEAACGRLRNACAARGVEFHVVLIQERDSVRAVPESKDLDHINDRLASLRRRAQVDASKLSLINVGDIAPSAPVLKRLEAALKEKSVKYYRNHARRIKRLSKSLQLPAQLALRVRRDFKVAIFYQMCALPDKAVEFFKSAYFALQDMRVEVDNADEVKGVAEILNYKLLKYYTSRAQGADAVAQFNRHMKLYRYMVGPPVWAYRHWAWVARQYLIMAHLLLKHIPRVTVATDPYQTAAYYFHAAALGVVERRRVAVDMRLIPPNPHTQVAGVVIGPRPAPQLPSSVDFEVLKPKFVGQPIVVSLYGDTHVLSPEQAATAVMQYRIHVYEQEESHADFSAQIIQSLELAQRVAVRDGRMGGGEEPFEKDSCFTFKLGAKPSRERLCRQAMIADELWYRGHFAAAQKLLLPVADGFRREQWWGPLTSAVERLLLCSHRMGDVERFIDYSLQLMSPSMVSSIKDKSVVQRKFLLALTYPDRLGPQFARSQPTPGASPLRIQVDPVRPLLAAAVGFSENAAQYGSIARVNVALQSFFPLPIHFSELALTFNDPQYDCVFRDPTPRRSKRRTSLQAVDAASVRGAMAEMASAAAGDNAEFEASLGGDMPILDRRRSSSATGSDVEMPTPLAQDAAVFSETDAGKSLLASVHAQDGSKVLSPSPRVAPGRSVDLCMLPEGTNDFDFEVHLVPPTVDIRDGVVTDENYLNREMLLACTKVTITLDLGSESGPAAQERTIVFEMQPMAEQNVTRSEMVRTVAMFPLRSGGEESLVMDLEHQLSRRPSVPQVAFPSGSTLDVGSALELLVTAPKSHLCVSIVPLPATLDAQLRAGATISPSQTVMLVGGLHPVQLWVDAGKECVAGGCIFMRATTHHVVLWMVVSPDSPAAPGDMLVTYPPSSSNQLKLRRVDSSAPIPLPSLNADMKHHFGVFVQPLEVGPFELHTRICFGTSDPSGPSHAEAVASWQKFVQIHPQQYRETGHKTSFSAVQPLSLSTQAIPEAVGVDCTGLDGLELDAASAGLARAEERKPFLLQASLLCNTTHPITVVSTSCEPGLHVTLQSLGDDAAVHGSCTDRVVAACNDRSHLVNACTDLSPEDIVTKCWRVRCDMAGPAMALGVVHVNWSRWVSRSPICAKPPSQPCFSHALPKIRVSLPPISAQISAPSTATVGTPFDVVITLHNSSSRVFELKSLLSIVDMSGMIIPQAPSSMMPVNPAFVVSGFQQRQISLLPRTSSILSLRVIPVAAGTFVVPSVSFSTPSKPHPLLDVADYPDILVYPQ